MTELSVAQGRDRRRDFSGSRTAMMWSKVEIRKGPFIQAVLE